MKTHREMIDEWMKDPEFVAEYDALADEFELFDEMLRARKNAGLTQADVAKKMGTKTPAVARLEASSAILLNHPQEDLSGNCTACSIVSISSSVISSKWLARFRADRRPLFWRQKRIKRSICRSGISTVFWITRLAAS